MMATASTAYSTQGTDIITAKTELLAAYRPFEKNGLELGRVAYKWRESFKSHGGYGSDGKGLVQLLDELSIPKSTVYYWIEKYEISKGLKEAKPKKQPEQPEQEPVSVESSDTETVDELRKLFKSTGLILMDYGRGNFSLRNLTASQVKTIAKTLARAKP